MRARREEYCKVHHTSTYAVHTETKPLCGKIKELDADLVIMVLDYIKVYESGRLTIGFFDETEFECETE